MGVKRVLYIIFILFLLTPLCLIGTFIFHPKVEVGIVLVDQCEERFGITAAGAFDQYPEYFNANVLPVRFNASSVRVRDGYYLNSDFFRLGQVEELREQYNVDVILFVTDHRIQDWDRTLHSLWGEADTVTGSALITVYRWKENCTQHALRIQQFALHEVFHLIGYTHNDWDRSGIMQPVLMTDDMTLSPYYELQLPSRVLSYKSLLGQRFAAFCIINSMFFATLLLPALIAVELVFYTFFESRINHRRPAIIIAGLNLLIGYGLLILVNGAYYNLTFPVIFMAFMHHFHYTYHLLVDSKRCRGESDKPSRLTVI